MFLRCYKQLCLGWNLVFWVGIRELYFHLWNKSFFWNNLHVPLWNKGTSSIVWCIDLWFPFYSHILQHIPYIFPYSPAFSFDFSMFPSIFFRFFHIPKHFLSICPYSQTFSLDLSIFPSIFLRFFQTPPAFSFDLATLRMVYGLVATFFCYACCELIKLLGLDDALDVWGVHGMGGWIGSILSLSGCRKKWLD